MLIKCFLFTTMFQWNGVFLWLDFKVEFDSQSYAMYNETPVEVYLLVDYPDGYYHELFFPFIVNVIEVDGTAIGKSLIVNFYGNLSNALAWGNCFCLKVSVCTCLWTQPWGN